MNFFAKLTRPVTAIALAASLALSPVAVTPAKANDTDLLIAGALGAILLGGLIASSPSVRTHSSAGVSISTGTPGYYPRTTPYQPAPTPYYNPRPTHNAYKVIPGHCAVNIGSGNNAGFYFGKTCLDRNFAGARQLPNYCKTTLVDRPSGRTRTVYNGACLQREGYQVAGRVR